MDILKKLIPYAAYMVVLLLVIIVAAVITYWDQMAKIVFATLVVSACTLLAIILLVKMITFH